jgi:hypothetical protein
MFIRLIYFFQHSQICGVFVIKGRELQIKNRALYRRKELESFALLVRKVTKQSRKGVGRKHRGPGNGKAR